MAARHRRDSAFSAEFQRVVSSASRVDNTLSARWIWKSLQRFEMLDENEILRIEIFSLFDKWFSYDMPTIIHWAQPDEEEIPVTGRRKVEDIATESDCQSVSEASEPRIPRMASRLTRRTALSVELAFIKSGTCTANEKHERRSGGLEAGGWRREKNSRISLNGTKVSRMEDESDTRAVAIF